MTDRKSKSYAITSPNEGSPFGSIEALESSDETVETPDKENVDDSELENQEPEENKDRSDDSEGDDNPNESDDEELDEESEEEEQDNDNAYYHLAQQLRSDGFISEEEEISEDIDALTVYNSYKNKLKEDLEESVRQDLINKYQNQGYTDEDLIIARAYRNGVDPRYLSEAGRYEAYASVPEDAQDSDKVAVIREMYRVRGFNNDEIDGQLSIIEKDKKVDEKFSESKSFFGSKYTEFKQQIKRTEEEAERKQKENEENVNNLIKSVITNREIRGYKLNSEQTKEIEKAIYTDNTVVEANGQKFKATALQKFLYEWQTNPELVIHSFIREYFKDQYTENIKKEAKKEVENDFLRGYEKSLKKRKSPNNSSRKKNVEENKDKDKKVNQYIVQY